MLKVLKALAKASPVLIIVGAIVATVVMMSMRKPPEKKDEAKPLLAVEVVEAERKPVQFLVDSQGTVRPKTQTTLVAEVAGRILSVSDKFRAGGLVEQGEVLARIDDADYLTALHSAEAELARAKAGYEEEKAKAEVAAQEWKSVSKDKVTDIALRKPQLAREAALVRSAEANLDKARRNLERTVIRAPFDGLVRERRIDLGQYVSPGTQLGLVDDTAVAEVRLPVSDTELAWLGLNSSQPRGVTIELQSEVAGETHRWQAKLVQSTGVLDEQSRLSQLVAEVPDPYGRDNGASVLLKFGTFVQASIQAELTRDLVVLPKSAVRGDQVVVLDENRRVQRRTVQVERTDSDFAYVTSGLEAGEQVALTPMSDVIDGTLVAIRGEAPSSDVAEGDTQLAVRGK
ncbi:efflux RND transporter periplasmic adaptor subunit [Gallaecimonas sp. GXIMD4217]|uniref:efflux RND transporter periplasmic adaptor subunit n=1 Tax=Gallaecimonas sp. GXIMD4217 TaxID=3131927 RepID=UPI00311B0769